MKKEIKIAGITIGAGETFRGFITVPNTGYRTPVTVINGRKEGRTLLISAGVHGGEYPGVASVSKVQGELRTEDISGAVIILNCLNYSGMMSMIDAHVPEDDKNINRDFPGCPDGTVTDRIKWWIATEIRPQVDFILDLHSGGQFEYLSDLIFYPAGCGEEMKEYVLSAAYQMDVKYLVASRASDGLYSWSAHQRTPGMILERSGHGECSREDIEKGIRDIYNLLIHLGIREGELYPTERKKRNFEETVYLEADISGFWYPDVYIDEEIVKGQRLGIIKDVFGNTLKEYHAVSDGTVLYMNGGLIAEKGRTNLIAYGKR